MPIHSARKIMHRKNLSLPAELYSRISDSAKDKKVKLSQLIKDALEDYLAREKKRQLENEVIEACNYYYEADKETANEWLIAEPKPKRQK
ncbi:MAG: type II toxin-antitoxin system CcdA family antitoxin [bacterium]